MHPPRELRFTSSSARVGLPIVLRDSPRQSEELTREFIGRTLDIYEPEFVTVKDAQWTGDQLAAKIDAPLYPFTKADHIDYITASMAFLVASQAGYLTCRYLIQNSLAVRQMGLSDKSFFESRNSGDIVFLKADVRFREKIRCGRSLRLVQSVTNVRISKNRVFAKLHTEFAGGGCVITGTLTLPLR